MFNHDELLNLMNSVQMSLCLSNLLLTGNATPYLHNGTLQIEDFDDEKWGIYDRNSIGFLIWDRNLEKTLKHNLGSRYLA